ETVFLSWIQVRTHDVDEHPFLMGIMAATPAPLAKIVCQLTDSTQLSQIDTIKQRMNVEQKDSFKEVYRIFFATFYENQLYGFQSSNQLNQQLIEILTDIKNDGDWIKKNQTLAQKYCELLVSAELDQNLQKELIQKYPLLFSLFTVKCRNESVKVPA